MTFKEQLKNDIDRLGTAEEFRNSLAEMLSEQAEKPRPKLYISVARYGAVAAAVCLLAFGAVELGVFRGDSINTASAPSSGTEAVKLAGDIAETTAETAAAQMYDGDEAEAEKNLDEEGSAGGLTNKASAADESADVFDDSKIEEQEIYVDESEDVYAYPEAAAAYDNGFYINEAPANEQISDAISIDSAADSFSAESVDVSVYDAPVYVGEPIYAEISTYCSDRPWYTAEEMAQNVRELGYRLARVKIGEALTEEEVKRQTSINSGFEGTYFHAQADGEDVIVYFFGSSAVQELDNPVYAEGDELYCALEEKNGVYMIREYPLGDIYTIGGEECIYLRIQPCELDAPQLISGSVSVTTTTMGNPARYYSAYRLDDFQREFLKLTEEDDESGATVKEAYRGGGKCGITDKKALAEKVEELYLEEKARGFISMLNLAMTWEQHYSYAKKQVLITVSFTAEKAEADGVPRVIQLLIGTDGETPTYMYADGAYFSIWFDKEEILNMLE